MKSSNIKYKVLVVEDDVYSSELMVNWVSMRDDLILAGVADSAAKVLCDFDLSSIDLIMLDIKLPDMTGIELLGKLSVIPYVIFTTAYEDFAIKAFDIGAIDYLVKPINFERFNKAITRFVESKTGGNRNKLKQPNGSFKNGKYKKSSISGKISDDYADLLLMHMKNEKPYLDPDITLKKLSDNLKIPQHHLSQIINIKLNTNYYAFLNKYRIDEVKRLMLDRSNNQKTIIDISLMAGFQSKSLFNKMFKELTGFTPGEFRNEISKKDFKPDKFKS